MIIDLLYVIGFAGCTVWLCIVVVHALRTNVIWNRAGNVSRFDQPKQFWICTTIAVLGVVFMLGMTIVSILGVSGQLK